MAGIISKLKAGCSNSKPPPPIENNPIMQYFEVGQECTTAGPGLVWRVHDAYRKSDGKECSVFVIDKHCPDKVLKPKRKDCMLEKLRHTVTMLDRIRHPKMLQVIHSLEEGQGTIAFATEPVLASLHNILAWHEANTASGPPRSQSPVNQIEDGTPYPRQTQAKEYYFLDIEIRYGLLQIIEALNYMHYTARQVHRNVCPQVIIVCKRGTWKLFGLEFIENIVSEDPTDMIGVPPWSVKVSKTSQPTLDYMAPEAQLNGQCNILSDMFSLGLVIAAVFNQGRPLVQAQSNPMVYVKQIEYLDDQVNAMLPRVPAALQEAMQRLLSRDPHPRPTTQLLPLIKYFKCQSEHAIQALQFLDVITMKEHAHKVHFYTHTLIDALPYIPKKLRWQHVWPSLQMEVKTAEVLAAALQPIIWMTNECTAEEFQDYVLPTLKQVYCRNLLTTPKNAQASIIFLENLHVVLRKCVDEETYSEIVSLLLNGLDNNNQLQVSKNKQTAALIALQNCADYIDNKTLHTAVLAKVRSLLERNYCDVKVISLILCFYEKVLYRLEKHHLMEHVIPTILIMRLHDPDIVTRVVKLYKTMIVDKKFGLTSGIMAQKMLPSLAPQTVNPSLNIDQFQNLMEILYDMLDNIDHYQREIITGPQSSTSPEKSTRSLRHQMSNDNVVAPPFNIPNLRVEQRKTSSAEDMARKHSVGGPSIQPTTSQSSVGTGIKKLGQWFFGSNNSTNSNNNNDSNFLRVASVFPNRRLSDNTLMTPKIRVAPSCASSPGGTPGSTAGLPARRHSSIGPQERRGSHVNLSPPTAHQYRGRGGSGSSLSVPATSHPAGGSMPNTSASVPFLLTSSMSSIRSRRPSACPSAGSPASGSLLQQISSGVVRHLPTLPRRMGAPAAPAVPAAPAAPSSGWSLSRATAAGYSALQQTVRKCPSLNITSSR